VLQRNADSQHRIAAVARDREVEKRAAFRLTGRKVTGDSLNILVAVEVQREVGRRVPINAAQRICQERIELGKSDRTLGGRKPARVGNIECHATP